MAIFNLDSIFKTLSNRTKKLTTFWLLWSTFCASVKLVNVCIVGEKGSTVGTHGNADCLLKTTYIKHNKYVVNQKLEYYDDISFRELNGKIIVIFLQNKICPFLRQVIGIYIVRIIFGLIPRIWRQWPTQY